ncbi:FecR domain-containing protein [Pseudomonas sp. RIT-PI-AD]|uniref:FecR domain-containing protein n=1 Tax=Pseudomonas sp. RIT-PI-AD TaxID=3035294 RepID=UPI0021D97BBC|nr:FecR domain-containing protein [Pseudomonas sp. RIT-PI-AD]
MNALPAAVEQAMEWHSRQRSGTFGAEERRDFERWLSDKANREAWETLQQRLGRMLAPLQQPGARQALGAAGQQRRALLRGALAVGGLGGSAYLLTRAGWPLGGLGADVASGTGERRPVTLADGSQVLLDAQSQFDIDFSARGRRLRLRQGRMLVQAAADHDRPLFIDCRQGRIELGAGRCVLGLENDEATLWMLEGRAQALAGASALAVHAGQAARLEAGIATLLPRPLGDPLAWSHGQLEAYDRTLGWVIERLRPYHHGILQVTERASALRISGVFSLDHSDQALTALGEILPIRVERYLGYWTRIATA